MVDGGLVGGFPTIAVTVWLHLFFNIVKRIIVVLFPIYVWYISKFLYNISVLCWWGAWLVSATVVYLGPSTPSSSRGCSRDSWCDRSDTENKYQQDIKFNRVLGNCRIAAEYRIPSFDAEDCTVLIVSSPGELSYLDNWGHWGLTEVGSQLHQSPALITELQVPKKNLQIKKSSGFFL